MRLLHLTTEGVAGVPDRLYSFATDTGAPLDAVLITGGTATGKTRLLEAIVTAKESIGAYGHRGPGERCVAAGRRTARIEATWSLSPAERARAKVATAEVTTCSVFGEGASAAPHPPEGLSELFRDVSGDARLGKFLYFHDARHLPAGRGAPHRPGGDTAIEARARLTRQADKYAGLRDYLVDVCVAEALELSGAARNQGVAVGAAAASRVAELREAMRPYLHGKVFDGIDPDGPGAYRVRFRAEDGAVLDLDDLSTSERHGVLLAVTLYRLHVHSSIVLIDTPELGHPPDEHAAVFRAITAVGGDRPNQVIAATTSLALLSARTWRSIRVDWT
jgi:hypothetical protein